MNLSHVILSCDSTSKIPDWARLSFASDHQENWPVSIEERVVGVVSLIVNSYFNFVSRLFDFKGFK